MRCRANCPVLSTLALALLLLAGPAAADPIAGLLEAHGKGPVVDFVLERRFGEISIERKGGVKSTYGRPNVDLVTVRSLAADAAQLGLSPDEFAAGFLAWQGEKEARSEARRQSDQRIPPDHVVRGKAPARAASARSDDVPTTADGLGVPQSSAPIQFLTPSELEAQDPSYACQRQCERKRVHCSNENPGDQETQMACMNSYHACFDRC